ncbi:MAG: hypothetical protein DRR19_20425 [Candidatus Parabeggiatoa sp. nov. 1]|nr:MAG: hypothetical protein DRR19_20425 [Gammaproteobacteria bacterium]
MALDYYLVIQDINNEIEPALVLESLSQALSLQINQISGFLIGVGVTFNVFKEDDEYEESLFGSPHPDICVAFRIDKFEHYESGMNTMRKIVIWLMSYFKGDMIFFLNEQKIFKRISNQLSLNNDSKFWSPAALYGSTAD